MKSIDFRAALLGGTAGQPGAPAARPEPSLVEKITTLLSAFFNAPLGSIMVFLALVLVIVAVGSFSTRRRDRVLMIVLAALAAISAWIIITGWRWPSHWPRLPI
jgi:hypothetical protein